MKDTFIFEKEEVKAIAETVRKVAKIPNVGLMPQRAMAQPTDFDKIIIIKLVENLERNTPAPATRVFRDTYASSWENVTDDEFDVIAPFIPEGKCLLADTICFAFWDRPSKEWFVFTADGCTVDCPE
jgi:hypothetical protein